MEINGLLHSLSLEQSNAFSKCFKAYASHFHDEDIFEIGLNKESGFAYISLENNITIYSILGKRVKYLVPDFDNGGEYVIRNHTSAINLIKKLRGFD